MEDDKLLPALPVTVANKTPVAAPPLPGVRDVIMWALINTGHVVLTVACAFIIHSIGQTPSWLQPCDDAGPVEMTDAEATVAADLLVGWLWCVVSQAAAAALALALPRDRRRLRLLLAATALVATTVGHSKWADLHRIFIAADPGSVCFWTGFTTVVIFMFQVVDLVCFLGLIFRGGEEEE